MNTTTNQTNLYVSEDRVNRAVRKMQQSIKGANSTWQTLFCDLSDVYQVGRCWSRSDFLKRLGTFSSTNWNVSINSLSPPQCSRFGWLCYSYNKLKCEYCLEFMNLGELFVNRFNINQDIVKKYTEALKNTHNAECYWRENECPDIITNFPIKNAIIYQQDFLLRLATYNLLEKFSKVKCPLDEETIETLTENILQNMVSWAPNCSQEFVEGLKSKYLLYNYRQKSTFILLSLFGWYLNHDNINQITLDIKNYGEVQKKEQTILKCLFCFRNINMDAFNKHDFDLIKEHKTYCQWISIKYNAGWKMILNSLMPPQLDPGITPSQKLSMLLKGVDSIIKNKTGISVSKKQ